MSIKTYRPTTPARRGMTVSGFDGVDKHAKPEKSLLEVLKKNAGRNSYGHITVRETPRPRSSVSSTTRTAARSSLCASMPTASAATSSPPWA